MAFYDNSIYAGYFFLTLLFAICMQIGCNFANDYSDGLRGTDTEERKGPLRVIQSGLVTPEFMQKVIILVFSLVMILGVFIAMRAGWEFVFLVALCILAALTYTGGPRPYGYMGLGEPFVFVFFGVVPVCGTYYIQRLTLTWEIFIASLALGAMATALLCMNNYRDRRTDKIANKKTLAVRYGPAFMRKLYASLLLFAIIVVPFVLHFMTSEHSFILLLCFLMFPAYSLIVETYSTNDEEAMNIVFSKTAKLTLIYGLVFSVVWQL